MTKNIGCWFAAAVLMSFAAQSDAVPITFEFNAAPYSVGWNGSEADVPAPFNNTANVWGSLISGSFTIESDTPATPFSIDHNGSWLTLLGSYDNPVTQADFTVAGQQFSFDSSRADAYSLGTVIDLPSPATDPTLNYDWIGVDINLGAGLFSGEYSHLVTTLSLSRTERDPGIIASTDLLGNLMPSTNWSVFFTIYDPGSFDWYQIHAPVTSLTQVSSVPEPTTSALLGVALVLGFSTLGRRKRA
ncbi:PEP-CTERM sorting domain-containing protein [Steroidobacter flavus]|uniref:PEP-CTERM sorting domain-containing protein n=1 Tax=Steroidobacter flavus TaxID=1842136 RepID=A0ABV8SUU3_9GAMM